jgi:TolA-binding protein
MKKIFYFALIFFFTASYILANSDIETEQENYQKEIQKFYFEKGEYNLSILAYEAIDYDVSDESKILYAKSLIALDSLDVAINQLSMLKQNTTNDTIKEESYNLIVTTLAKFDALKKIEILIKVFELNEDKNQDVDLLLLVANTYEEIKLFSEANDIYYNILNSIAINNPNNIRLKISLNLIQMERYSEAQKELDKIINAEDVEYLSDALFYNFIACLALDDYSKASENLLKLVYEFPEDERMPDIYEQLANVYFLQEQYLFSWYWYEKLYAISLHAEQLLILDKIEAIKFFAKFFAFE